MNKNKILFVALLSLILTLSSIPASEIPNDNNAQPFNLLSQGGQLGYSFDFKGKPDSTVYKDDFNNYYLVDSANGNTFNYYDEYNLGNNHNAQTGFSFDASQGASDGLDISSSNALSPNARFDNFGVGVDSQYLDFVNGNNGIGGSFGLLDFFSSEVNSFQDGAWNDYQTTNNYVDTLGSSTQDTLTSPLSPVTYVGSQSELRMQDYAKLYGELVGSGINTNNYADTLYNLANSPATSWTFTSSQISDMKAKADALKMLNVYFSDMDNSYKQVAFNRFIKDPNTLQSNDPTLREFANNAIGGSELSKAMNMKDVVKPDPVYFVRKDSSFFYDDGNGNLIHPNAISFKVELVNGHSKVTGIALLPDRTASASQVRNARFIPLDELRNIRDPKYTHFLNEIDAVVQNDGSFDTLKDQAPKVSGTNTIINSYFYNIDSPDTVYTTDNLPTPIPTQNYQVYLDHLSNAKQFLLDSASANAGYASPSTLLALAQTAALQNNLGEAAGYYRTVSYLPNIDPKTASTANYNIAILSRQQGYSSREVYDYIDQAIALNPDNSAARNARDGFNRGDTIVGLEMVKSAMVTQQNSNVEQINRFVNSYYYSPVMSTLTDVLYSATPESWRDVTIYIPGQPLGGRSLYTTVSEAKQAMQSYLNTENDILSRQQMGVVVSKLLIQKGYSLYSIREHALSSGGEDDYFLREIMNGLGVSRAQAAKLSEDVRLAFENGKMLELTRKSQDGAAYEFVSNNQNLQFSDPNIDLVISQQAVGESIYNPGTVAMVLPLGGVGGRILTTPFEALTFGQSVVGASSVALGFAEGYASIGVIQHVGEDVANYAGSLGASEALQNDINGVVGLSAMFFAPTPITKALSIKFAPENSRSSSTDPVSRVNDRVIDEAIYRMVQDRMTIFSEANGNGIVPGVRIETPTELAHFKASAARHGWEYREDPTNPNVLIFHLPSERTTSIAPTIFTYFGNAPESVAGFEFAASSSEAGAVSLVRRSAQNTFSSRPVYLLSDSSMVRNSVVQFKGIPEPTINEYNPALSLTGKVYEIRSGNVKISFFKALFEDTLRAHLDVPSSEIGTRQTRRDTVYAGRKLNELVENGYFSDAGYSEIQFTTPNEALKTKLIEELGARESSCSGLNALVTLCAYKIKYPEAPVGPVKTLTIQLSASESDAVFQRSPCLTGLTITGAAIGPCFGSNGFNLGNNNPKIEKLKLDESGQLNIPKDYIVGRINIEPTVDPGVAFKNAISKIVVEPGFYYYIRGLAPKEADGWIYGYDGRVKGKDSTFNQRDGAPAFGLNKQGLQGIDLSLLNTPEMLNSLSYYANVGSFSEMTGQPAGIISRDSRGVILIFKSRIQLAQDTGTMLRDLPAIKNIYGGEANIAVLPDVKNPNNKIAAIMPSNSRASGGITQEMLPFANEDEMILLRHGDFTHDLNNRMAGVIGYYDLLKMAEARNAPEADIKKMQDKYDASINIVNGFLGINVGETGSQSSGIPVTASDAAQTQTGENILTASKARSKMNNLEKEIFDNADKIVLLSPIEGYHRHTKGRINDVEVFIKKEGARFSAGGTAVMNTELARLYGLKNQGVLEATVVVTPKAGPFAGQPIILYKFAELAANLKEVNGVFDGPVDRMPSGYVSSKTLHNYLIFNIYIANGEVYAGRNLDTFDDPEGRTYLEGGVTKPRGSGEIFNQDLDGANAGLREPVRIGSNILEYTEARFGSLIPTTEEMIRLRDKWTDKSIEDSANDAAGNFNFGMLPDGKPMFENSKQDAIDARKSGRDLAIERWKNMVSELGVEPGSLAPQNIKELTTLDNNKLGLKLDALEKADAAERTLTQRMNEGRLDNYAKNQLLQDAKDLKEQLINSLDFGYELLTSGQKSRLNNIRDPNMFAPDRINEKLLKSSRDFEPTVMDALMSNDFKTVTDVLSVVTQNLILLKSGLLKADANIADMMILEGRHRQLLGKANTLAAGDAAKIELVRTVSACVGGCGVLTPFQGEPGQSILVNNMQAVRSVLDPNKRTLMRGMANREAALTRLAEDGLLTALEARLNLDAQEGRPAFEIPSDISDADLEKLIIASTNYGGAGNIKEYAKKYSIEAQDLYQAQKEVLKFRDNKPLYSWVAVYQVPKNTPLELYPSRLEGYAPIMDALGGESRIFTLPEGVESSTKILMPAPPFLEAYDSAFPLSTLHEDELLKVLNEKGVAFVQIPEGRTENNEVRDSDILMFTRNAQGQMVMTKVRNNRINNIEIIATEFESGVVRLFSGYRFDSDGLPFTPPSGFTGHAVSDVQGKEKLKEAVKSIFDRKITGNAIDDQSNTEDGIILFCSLGGGECTKLPTEPMIGNAKLKLGFWPTDNESVYNFGYKIDNDGTYSDDTAVFMEVNDVETIGTVPEPSVSDTNYAREFIDTMQVNNLGIFKTPLGNLPAKNPVNGLTLTFVEESGRVTFGYGDETIDLADFMNEDIATQQEFVSKFGDIFVDAQGHPIAPGTTGNVIKKLTGFITRITGFVSAKITGNPIYDNVSENATSPRGFIAICDDKDCTTFPTIMEKDFVAFELGVKQEPSGLFFGYHPTSAANLDTRANTDTSYPSRIIAGGTSTLPITDPSEVISDEYLDANSKELLLFLLGRLQLVTPQYAWTSVLQGKSDVRGISLSYFNSSQRDKLLTTLFNAATPNNNQITSAFVNGVNHTAIYKGISPSTAQIIVYQIKGNIPLQTPEFLLPFAKTGVNVSVEAEVCLNGIKEQDEECDFYNGNLNNSIYCPQDNRTSEKGVNMIRDGRGSCTLSCKCAYDSFVPENASAIVLPAECTQNNDCNVGSEKCINGQCIAKTYCGDGLVQSVNDAGIAEECDPAEFLPFVGYGVSDTGQCKRGVASCNSQCKINANSVLGMILPSISEICDSIDNNCNGIVDEGCQCNLGQTQACGSNVGQCKQGVQGCTIERKWGACVGEIASSKEVCDGTDNNCNGIVDEGCQTSASRDDVNSALTPKDGFVLTRSNSQSGPYSPLAILNSVSDVYIDADLNANTTYYYAIYTFDGKLVSTYASNASARTLVSPIIAPSALNALALGDAQIRLTWTDASDNEEGFNILMSNNSASNFVAVDKTPANVANIVISGLRQGKTYYFKVQAYNNIGDKSPDSTTASAMTLMSLPLTPSSLINVSSTSNNIVLSWVDNSDNELGFRVWTSSSAPGTYTLAGSTGENVNSITITGLTAQTVYYYKVQAYNIVGSSGNSSVIFASTLPNRPAKPTLSTSAISNTQIGLTWTNVANEQGYRIFRANSSTALAERIATVGQDIATYTDSGLLPGTYYYIVVAYNTAGESDDSNTAYTTVPSVAAPASPTGLIGSFTSTSSVNLQWNYGATNPTRGFTVRVVNNANGQRTPVQLIPTPNPTPVVKSTSISGLTLTNNMYFVVTAVNANGLDDVESSDSNPVWTRPDTPTVGGWSYSHQCAPPIPTIYTCIAYGASWTNVNNEGGYTLSGTGSFGKDVTSTQFGDSRDSCLGTQPTTRTICATNAFGQSCSTSTFTTYYYDGTC